MRSGRLRCPVDLLRPTTTRDATGAPVKSYVVEVTLRADLVQQGSREYERFDLPKGEVSAIFTFRDTELPASFSTSWRLRLRGVEYDAGPAMRPDGGRDRVVMIPATQRGDERGR